jgi:hypothetical protein
MDYMKQFKALDNLNCSYEVRNEIEKVIFSGLNNADDTASEKKFTARIGNQETEQWINIYIATVKSILDSEQHSKECIDFFKSN